MMKEEIKFPSIKIRSIYELAKIKELLRKGSKSKVNMFSSFSS